jgi:hypothetical protein
MKYLVIALVFFGGCTKSQQVSITTFYEYCYKNVRYIKVFDSDPLVLAVDLNGKPIVCE